ncbi:hypothetical protein EYS14_13435 [Alteromonadaceae bacterium M269]|nr:hypothetical protein EYS14_13435 [Alteromonadaceae bacterium M269]
MNIDEQIKNFAYGELPHFLETILVRINSESPVTLRFIDTPKVLGRSDTQNNEISISLGWMQRITILFALLERMWETRGSRAKLYAINEENAFDAYFFDDPSTIKDMLAYTPNLQCLFIDEFHEDEHRELLDEFCMRFNEHHEGANIPSNDNEKPPIPLLNFNFTNSLSKSVKRKTETAFKFLLYHEFAHINRMHHKLSCSKEQFIFNEIRVSGIESPNHLKACEVDADTQALKMVIGDSLNSSTFVTKDRISELLTNIFIFLSSFDISRKSITEYRGRYASHPAPDVRAYAAITLTQQYFQSEFFQFSKLLKSAFVQAVTYTVRSFQQLGISRGAFLIIGNELLTLNKQKFSVIFTTALIQDELAQIAPYVDDCFKLNGESIKGLIPTFCPIGMTEENFQEYCKEFFLQAFSKHGNQNKSNAEEDYINSLKRIKEELGIVKGDTLIAVQNQNKSSPYIEENLEENSLLFDSDFEQTMIDEHSRIMELAMSLAANKAGVT